MSVKKRGGDHASSIIPFLAVLLCTIGALVLILALSVTTSHASAKRETEQQIAQAKDAAELMQVVSDELEAHRKKLTGELESKRRELEHIEDHTTRLMKELEELTHRSRAIEERVEQTDEKKKEQADTVAKLRDQIEKKKKEIADEIANQKNKKPAFAIVPYVGPNGTSRRPVYLECRKEGVVVQPEGILIRTEDLRPPFGPGNPLDSALRVLRVAYQKKDTTFGITQPPYPLLMVRPDGIQTYALARSAMGSWDDQFGYELIEGDMKLAFPEGLPGLSEQLVSAIDIARQRQQAMIASIPRQMRDAQAWEEQTSWGDGDGVGPQSSGSQSSGGSRAGAGGKGSGVIELPNAVGSNWEVVQELAPGQVVGSGVSRSGTSAGTGSSAVASQTPGSQSAGGPSMNKFSGAQIGGQYAVAGNAPGTSGNAAVAGGGPQFSVNEMLAASPSDADPANQNGTSGAPNFYNSANGSAGTNGGSGNVGGNSAANQSSGNSAAGNSVAGNGNAGGGNASGGSGNGNGSGGQPGNALTNALGGQGGDSKANAFSSGNAGGGNAGMQSLTGSGSPSDDPSQQPQLPSISMNLNPAGGPPPVDGKQPANAKHVKPDGDLKPISVGAGRGWAASRAEGKATPVSRPINIVALSDRWLVRADDGTKTFETTITMERGPQAAGDQLATAIRNRVDSWGLSLPGGYWCPTLTIEAASDASLSVSRLQRLLEGSGVEIRVVPLQLPTRR